MYVCICNAIRETEVRELARQGVTDAGNVHERCGFSTNCASCLDIIQIILDIEHSENGTVAAIPDPRTTEENFAGQCAR